MSITKRDKSMSNPKPENQKRLDELAESIWTPEELEEAKRKWEELDLAMEFSSAVDRKEAVRCYLNDKIGNFITHVEELEGPNEVSVATKEDMLKRILAEVTEQRAIVDKLAAKEKEQVKEAIREIAAERKAEAEKAYKAQLMTRDEIVAQVELAHKYKGRFADENRKSFLNKVNRFLDFAPADYRQQWTKTLALSFMNEIEKEGWSEGTQVAYYTAMKACFDAVGQTLPKQVKPPKIDKSKLHKPAFQIEQGKQFIRTAKKKKLKELSSEQTAYVALWTTFGMRRMELADVLQEDLNYEQHWIKIRTEKKGVKRRSYLPDQIIPYLQKYQFPLTEDATHNYHYMTECYRQMEKKVGIKHVYRMGWHSMRRTLDTWLKHRVGKDNTGTFFRWAKSKEMVDVYDVSDQLILDVEEEPMKIDREIFQSGHHPFIGEWEKNVCP